MIRILVIEDETDALAHLVLMLEMEGFAVTGATDGKSGIDYVRTHRPDLILCDVAMPTMDGYAVLAAVRADPALAATPFIFLTARSNRSDLRHGMDLGADDYLTKPATAEEVLCAIHGRLARQRTLIGADTTGRHLDFSSSTPLEALGLSPREAEVLLWICQGKTNAHVASILGCSDHTVKTHLSHVYDKLGCENRNAATVIAWEALAGSG